MLFSEILGQETLKKQLIHTADSGRIPHAQLFIGPEGSGTLPMAIAYAQYVMCKNTSGENTGTNAACNLKFAQFQHPDLHFIYPTVTTEEVKSKPKSIDFLQDWRAFLMESVYGSLFDWYQKLGVKNKQGEIRVDDAAEMMRSLSLKSYEGGYKFMIVWMVEKMNEAASNKILKMLEEPEPNTVFILIAQDEEALLQTIRSRCQTHYFPPVPESVIAGWLHEKHGQDKREALRLARQANGNVNKALHLLRDDGEEGPVEQWFVDWVRAAF